MKFWRIWWLLMLVGGVACQPQVLYVVVTPDTAVTASPPAPQPTNPPSLPLEVTRLVPLEVTRVVTTTTLIEVTKSPLGTSERPIQLLFPPTFNSTVIQNRAQPIATAITAATGLQVTIGVLDSQAALVDLLCAAPADTIGILMPLAYVAAQERCGVQTAVVGRHIDGQIGQIGMIVTRRDSNLLTLTDLAGKRWAVPDDTSLSEYLYFQALLQAAGVTPGEIVFVPGDNSAMLAVYQQEVDFATATYIPPVMPFMEPWVYGTDRPEPWRALGIPPTRSPIGYVLVNGEPERGGYRLRDARSGVFDTTPGIFSETSILALSEPIPNESVVFGRDFPLGLARQVITTLTTLSASEACAASWCATDFYSWVGAEPIDDAAFASVRFLATELGLTEEDFWGLSE